MKHITRPSACVALCVGTLMTGCAVTPQEVTKAYEDKSTAIVAAKKQATVQRAPQMGYTVIRGNYLGGELLVSNTGTGLPEKFRRNQFNQVK